MPDSTLTLVLATDRGAGLDPLTLHRPKAAVPFGGKYRIIDFTLANCLHSGLRQVLVLTQYKSHSLHKHLRDGWFIFNPELGEFITAVPPQQREGLHWYGGPFDAIRQNRYLLERSPASQVLVLEGAAIYRMDYAELIRAHRESGAPVTLALRGLTDPGGGCQTRACVDGEGRVTALAAAGASIPSEGCEALATMGVYCFDKAWLLAALDPSDASASPDQDLALDRLAPVLASERVLGYRFGEQRGRVTPDRYWCSLDSIDAYYQANMALLRAEPPIDLYQADWNIRTYQGQILLPVPCLERPAGPRGSSSTPCWRRGPSSAAAGSTTPSCSPGCGCATVPSWTPPSCSTGSWWGRAPSCATASSRRTWRSPPRADRHGPGARSGTLHPLDQGIVVVPKGFSF